MRREFVKKYNEKKITYFFSFYNLFTGTKNCTNWYKPFVPTGRHPYKMMANVYQKIVKHMSNMPTTTQIAHSNDVRGPAGRPYLLKRSTSGYFDAHHGKTPWKEENVSRLLKKSIQTKNDAQDKNYVLSQNT
jgi:hypothetical protein